MMDRKYIITSMLYAIIGMILGIMMAATKNHGQMPTHAHVLLAGFVVSFIYALCHKLWLTNSDSGLSKIQFVLHQIGIAVLSIGLFFLYQGTYTLEQLDPILASSSFLILLGMITMFILFIKSDKLPA